MYTYTTENRLTVSTTRSDHQQNALQSSPSFFQVARQQVQRKNEPRSSRKIIVVGNETFVASGKRLSNKRFANAREKNTIAYDGIHNRSIFSTIYYVSFSVPFMLPMIFRVLCTRYVNARSRKSMEKKKHKTSTMFYLSLFMYRIILSDMKIIFLIETVGNCLTMFHTCNH